MELHDNIIKMDDGGWWGRYIMDNEEGEGRKQRERALRSKEVRIGKYPRFR